MLSTKIVLITTFLFSFASFANEISFSRELSPWQEFTINATTDLETTTFQLNIESSDSAKEGLFIADLIDPTGKVLIKNNLNSPMRYRVPPQLYSTMRNSLRPTYVAPGLFSISLDQEQAQGKWRFRIAKAKKQGEAKAFWHLSYGRKSLLEVPQLDLDVLIADSFTHIGNQELQLSLDQVVELYESYGIKLNFSSSTKWKDPIANNSDLEEKLKAVSNKRRSKPTLYLINRLNSSVDKDFQGLAGCLPGFIVKFVDAHCALLVSITDKERDLFDNDKLTKVIAHEIAHLLGLFHLEDDFYPFGKLLDPFEDTSIERDLVNVMHKTSDYFGLLEFSPSQVDKMRSLPLLFQTSNL